MPTVAPLSSTNPVDYQTAQTKALQLLSAFNSSSINRSSFYINLNKQSILKELQYTVKNINLDSNFNNRKPLLGQGNASLCGPAAFFFTLAKVRPDIYVHLVIDLYVNGQTQLNSLKLQSSAKARQHKPVSMNQSDWLLLSSINPKYDHPSEQLDGITLPGKLKNWCTSAGFTQVQDKTSLLSHETLDTLLQAQNDYSSGSSVIFLVNSNVFQKFGSKSWGAGLPDHWVVMNSDIRIRLYNEKTKTLSSSVIINQSVIKSIKEKMRAKENDALFDREISTETEDRILLDAFSWGKLHTSVASRISPSQDALLSYFLSRFYGYINVKR